jgi:hypothetical protein
VVEVTDARVPVEVDASGTRNDAGSSSTSSIDKNVRPEIQGATTSYGPVSLDTSVAPISIGINPTILRGDTASKLSDSASQNGDSQWATLLKLAIPAAAAIVLALLSRRDSDGYL